MIDIFKLNVKAGYGATLEPAGVHLTKAWGNLVFENVHLGPGWFELRVKGINSAACLQLYDIDDFKVIELSANPESPAYVRLNGGEYEPCLYVGARPRHYPFTAIQLRQVGPLVLSCLFGKRLFQALKQGVSLSRLQAMLRLAFNRKASFGVRTHTASDGLGMLTGADYHMASHDAAPGFETTSGPVFLIQFRERPMLDSEAEAAGLPAQTYKAFTLNPENDHQAVLFLDVGDRLTPDALMLLVEHMNGAPDQSVFLTDKWTDGTPTTHVAFDPLLYQDGWPTPYVLRRGFEDDHTVSWHDQAWRASVLSLPLAFGENTPVAASIPALPFNHKPLVTVIIPTRDRADLLRNCLAGLFNATNWPHEVLVVDNGSTELEMKALLEAYAAKGLRVIEEPSDFNFSSLCNQAAAQARGEYLLFMNNDIEVLGSEWLREMMSYAVQDNVGAVGARLCYANGRLQHAGIFLGLTELCGHLWRGMDKAQQEKTAWLQRASLRSAVTGALLCVSKSKFEAVGGFDAEHLPVTLNDVDLCLKLKEKGWFSVLASQTVALHHESESRGHDESPQKRLRRLNEMRAFYARWRQAIHTDPWLPAAIMRSTETFGLK